jgi:hypothetical protein
MSSAPTFRRIGAFLDPRPARWSTVVLLTIVLAYADGAVVTIIKGATGSIARVQSPFSSWLIDSTALLPFFLLGVLVAFRVAHRRIGPELRRPKQVIAGAVLIGLIGTVVGIAALVASGAYDYSLQSAELQAAGPVHNHDAGLPGTTGVAGVAAGHNHDGCEETCQEQQQTLSGDVQAIGIGGPIMLGANLVLVGWLVGLLGGTLSSARGETSADATSKVGVPAAAQQGR